MEDIFEIISYLLLFAAVYYLNIQKEKKKRRVPSTEAPDESTTEIPLPDFFEEMVKPAEVQKAPVVSSAPKEQEVIQYQAQLKEKVVPTPKAKIPLKRGNIENQKKKKINLRKAILYSEIINRRYE